VLDELLRVRGMSTRQWAGLAGVSLATIHRVSQPGARPTSLTVARLGLAAGLRLELAPLREQDAPQRKRPPTLPDDPPGGSPRVDAAFLLALAGAELRHERRRRRLSAGDLAQELSIAGESILRAERRRAPWARLDALETLALAAGCSLTWQPVGAGWRPRPWQKKTTPTLTPERQRALARKAGPRGALYLSLDQAWRTPRPLFVQLDEEFGFSLDAAALSTNALCASWLGPDHPNPHRRDALRGDHWADIAHEAGPGWVFVNPPYGAGIGEWSARAAATATAKTGVVALLPARTDTTWWHRDVLDRSAEIRFIKGRLHFSDSGLPAPFASVLVIWRP